MVIYGEEGIGPARLVALVSGSVALSTLGRDAARKRSPGAPSPRQPGKALIGPCAVGVWPGVLAGAAALVAFMTNSMRMLAGG